MRLTKSQTELLSLSLGAPRRGLSFAIVHVVRGSGLTTAVREILRRGESSAESFPVSVYGGGGWEAAVDLSVRTGTAGMGYAMRLKRALEYLTRGGQRPVTLLMHHAEQMSHAGQGALFGALEYVCDEGGYDVRCVLLAHKQYRWNSKEAKRQGQDAVFIGWIYDKATHAFRFTRDGLDQICKSEPMPLLDRATA